MSKQAATLLVGLLALAEGRSDEFNMLREADREDVFDEVHPELLDRIAHRLYAEDEEHLSAYERLLKDDKRKKMDYLNGIRPDLHAKALEQEAERQQKEHVPATHHEGMDHVQDARAHRRNQIDDNPAGIEKYGDDVHRQHHRSHYANNEDENLMQETTRTPREEASSSPRREPEGKAVEPKHITDREKELQFQEELIH